MDGSVRGMPLLSGPAPHREEPNANSCRRCNKDFGLIFRSSKTCNFCGFTYCSSCADHQALMPRQGSPGYDPVNVCSYCIELLTITASSRNQLRGIPVSKLKGYLKAFNIQTPGALEKDDIVQAILDARQPNGCLPPTNEDYYRRNSVPDTRRGRAEKRSFLDRAADAARQAFDIPAPPPTGPTPGPSGSRPRSQPPPQSRGSTPQNVPPRNTPPRTYGSASGNPAGANPRSYPHQGYSPYQQRPAYTPPRPNTNTNTRPPPQPQQQTRPQPPRRASTPIPTLESLLNTPADRISALSAHVLKEILHQNHVNARLILEKDELVQKVLVLVDNERRERERAAAEEEREAIERQHRMMAEMQAREAQARPPAPPPPSVTVTAPTDSAAGEAESAAPTTPTQTAASIPLPASPQPTPGPPPVNPYASMERQGLCVVCQDAEANMALVDCGHLALCKSCSELIWSTTRECPLCRTRIVTQERMLRIFRT